MMAKSSYKPLKDEDECVAIDKSSNETTYLLCLVNFVNRHSLCILLCAVVLVFSFYITIKHGNDINDIYNQQNEFNKKSVTKDEVRKRINDSEKSLRRFIFKRIADIRQNEIRQMKTDLRHSFNAMKNNLTVLISSIGNLSAASLRMNISSDTKLFRLRSNLNETTNDLIGIQNELAQLNYTIYKDKAHSTVSAVKDLMEELNTLSHSTSAKADEVWKQWNSLHQTSRTNRSWHKAIENIARSLRSSVTKLNETIDGIKQSNIDFQTKYFQTKIDDILNDFSVTKAKFQEKDRKHDLTISDQASKTKIMEKKMEDHEGKQRTSMTNMHNEVDEVKKEFRAEIDNILHKQEEMKDYSETKDKLQEIDHKHNSDNSNQLSKLENMENKMKDLERKQESKTRKISKLEKDLQNLRDNVNEIKNKANRVLGINLPPILLLFIIAVLSYSLN